MLDSYIFRSEIKGRYLLVGFFSFLISSLSLIIIYNYVKFIDMAFSGIIALFFTVVALSYPLLRFAKFEEAKEEKEIRRGIFKIFRIKLHETLTYLSFFLGVTFSYLILYNFIPKAFFEAQNISISSIIGNCPAISGAFSSRGFASILENNTGVFFLSFFLSFLFSGAFLFILAWNASIFGIFLSSNYGVMPSLYYYLFLYLPHGLIEIAAFTIAGLSGSFLARETEKLLSKEKGEIYKGLVFDVLGFLAFGYALLILAAFIEVL
jgi:uncharacterized membrane protein SpoIIM required for sporulation